MDNRILVAYATWLGATAEVAEAIGEALGDHDIAVEVRPACDVHDVTAYRAVILGTGIRVGQVHPDALSFADTHQEALSRKPVALFVVCLTMREDTEDNRRTTEGYLDPLLAAAPQMKPVSLGLFGGALDYKKVPTLYRWIVKLIKMPEGDFRNWKAIAEWAKAIRPTLLGA